MTVTPSSSSSPGLDLADPSLLRQQAYVDGAWIAAADGAVMTVTNPADGSVLASVAAVGRAETDQAVAAAARAFPAWRARTAKDRAAILRRWHDLMLTHQEDLARLMTAEQGKPLAESRGEIAYGAAFLEWYAEEGKRIYGDTIPQHQPDKRILVTKEPIGVTAAITPWNFPSAMITRKAAPALAAGCPMVLKPAPSTPLSALALAALAERAGVPAGVFNVVTGPAEAIGPVLTDHPAVRKLSFTGSTATGKKLMQACAGTVKKLSLELGGNAPFIVFDDADLEAAVEGAIASKYRNNGQTCVCANRFLIQSGIYEAFAEKLAAKVAGMKVGNGMAADVTLGPLINAEALAKVEAHIADALEKGAKLALGGQRHSLGGWFFEPTILTDVNPAMRVAREETFGPVAPLFRFDSDAEALALANDTEFGLAAYFYARDVGRVWRVSEGLEYGIVGVNTGIISTEVAPFGGVKESGIGREGSRYGIEEFLEMKYICLGGI